MIDFSTRLGQSGELVAAEGLAGPDQAKLVRAGKNGAPITDGVFPEFFIAASEQLQGRYQSRDEQPQQSVHASNVPEFVRDCQVLAIPSDQEIALVMGRQCR